MSALFGFFNGDNAGLMAGVVAFVSFFLIARLVRARQSVALVFGLLPLLAVFAVEAVAAGLV